jgi:hypothetical protein
MRASNIRKPGRSMRELSKAEIDRVHGGAITAVKENNGGNTPNGNAHGVPTENQNPTGFPPPGHNKG